AEPHPIRACRLKHSGAYIVLIAAARYVFDDPSKNVVTEVRVSLSFPWREIQGLPQPYLHDGPRGGWRGKPQIASDPCGGEIRFAADRHIKTSRMIEQVANTHL